MDEALDEFRLAAGEDSRQEVLDVLAQRRRVGHQVGRADA
jgi:hypothetical protein